ncbi:glucan biosynthesis protein [Hyphomicrobium sp.]|jgi:glucans biosynthesis protein|uniref:glucan biosynthesis protein n=1 Tax=Hyphomicrobium sp. TaxID=82 RepID=UPI003564FE06
MTINRRNVLSIAGGAIISPFCESEGCAAATFGLLSSELGTATKFSFDAIKHEAELLSKKPYVPLARTESELVNKIDYDAYQGIRYRKERTIYAGADVGYPIQLFHLGRYAPDTVDIAIVSKGYSRNIIYRQDLFDIPADNPAAALPEGIGFAGLRIMSQDLLSDWFAMIGASYFRSASPFNQYGLSARGIAVNTASAVPEEFPKFVHLWLEQSIEPGSPLFIYALLNGPSVTGAYKMQVRRAPQSNRISNSEMNIEANLYLRSDVERVGIAPFSSMFWYGEAAVQQPRDWRPEIHDSDGRAMFTGAGERICRPLRNPPQITTNTFVDHNPKGFGLLQRDRHFDHYLDDGVFYDKRPSVWVEPIGEWGEGAVHLVEMPTGEETWDNVVAYWCPSSFRKAGESRTFHYTLNWCDQPELPQGLASTIGTWTGIGGPPGLGFKEREPNKVKVVIDFKGNCFNGLDRASGVELIVDASRGAVTNSVSYPVVGEALRWRAMFDVETLGLEIVDLRAYLRFNGQALTETWIYQLNPLTV